MGQIYAATYDAYHDCDLVAIAEANPERRQEVGERYSVPGRYADVQELLRAVVPEVVSIVLPTRLIPPAVIACAEAGVRAISAEKPILARLADGDAMLEACQRNRVIFSGGNLQRAMPEVQEAAGWVREGRLGRLQGACLHLGEELSGSGVQPLSIVRLLVGSEVEWVQGWIDPPEAAFDDRDVCQARGILHFTNGVQCQVFPSASSGNGVEVWGENGLLRWNWAAPELFAGFDAEGARLRSEAEYALYEYSEFGYLTGALRSMIRALESGNPDALAVSGRDLCQAIEIAIALKLSARRGNVRVYLPLPDRELAMYPVPYRWLGGDATGGRYPDAEGDLLPPPEIPVVRRKDAA